MTYYELLARAEHQFDNGYITLEEYEKMIEPLRQEMPSVQPKQKVGHWIYIDDDCELYDSYECSECKRQITVDACRKDDIGFVIEDMEFCPRCGSYNGGGSRCQ